MPFFALFLFAPFISLAFSATSFVVRPAFSTQQTCIAESSAPNGPIIAQMNKAFTGGQFTFYGIGGRGACGLDIDTPTMSAAGSGTLFNDSAPWVPSCLPDKRYLLNDAVCVQKCVQIEYKQKILTVPINNKCSGCAIGHVDLSMDAFKWLESDPSVGVAKGATITYKKCP